MIIICLNYVTKNICCCVLQIQQLGLAPTYREDDEVRHFCGMLDGLAFLPLHEVHDGMQYLKDNIPDVPGLDDLVAYFDATYVRGVTRALRRPSFGGRRMVTRFRRVAPLYQPAVWNVHDATLADQERTNNVCEGWNHAFASLIGHAHPSLWVLLSRSRWMRLGWQWTSSK